jgi:hypothetical protein
MTVSAWPITSLSVRNHQQPDNGRQVFCRRGAAQAPEDCAAARTEDVIRTGCVGPPCRLAGLRALVPGDRSAQDVRSNCSDINGFTASIKLSAGCRAGAVRFARRRYVLTTAVVAVRPQLACVGGAAGLGLIAALRSPCFHALAAALETIL